MELDQKARLKLIGFDIVLVVTVVVAFFLAINYYNNTAGRACESNAQCSFYCPAGAYNENFINIYKGPFAKSGCEEGTIAFCQSNKCEIINVYETIDPLECEKIGGGFFKFLCYLELAKKNNETAICEKIEFRFDRSYCYFVLAKQMGELKLCNSIEDQEVRATCIGENFGEAPAGYRSGPSFEGSCGKRPLFTVCLTFSDGYTLFVYDLILETKREKIDGHEIEIALGRDSDYYHILYTDYVKEIEKSG